MLQIKTLKELYNYDALNALFLTLVGTYLLKFKLDALAVLRASNRNIGR